jgi:gluconate 2-dehydrogenase gamma chain
MSKNLGRREFLERVAAVGTAAAAFPVPADAAPVAQSPAQRPQDATAPRTPTSGTTSAGYTFLTAPEAAFIEAVVDVLVPADELTPSGTDLGIAVFIDRQLGGAWGKGDRLYMQGPWRQGPPGLGYQLPLTPAEFVRAGIDAVNRHCKKTYSQEFDQLAGPEKQQVLEGLDQAKITLEGIPAKQFFDTVYQATMEGMFSDPIYGGNRNKAAWRMVGFPGVVAVYATHIVNYRNKKYVVDPVSIADLL